MPGDEASSRFSLASDWEYAGGKGCRRFVSQSMGEVLVKLEYYNPTGLLQRSHGVGND